MSGHSKWSTIKRKKGVADAKRGAVFTRLAREIVISAREGGGDPDANFRLRLAVDKARAENMPKDNIERAIKRGTGELDGGSVEEITYEAYGPEGVAFIVDVVTDNRNRALADVKHVFNKNGGSLATNGAVSWQFDQKGYIELKADGLDFEEVFMVAAEAGADDVTQEDGAIIVYTPREMFGAVESALEGAGYEVEESELRWEPQNETEVPLPKALTNLRIIEQLEELDDVDSVASSLRITDEIAAAYETA